MEWKPLTDTFDPKNGSYGIATCIPVITRAVLIVPDLKETPSELEMRVISAGVENLEPGIYELPDTPYRAVVVNLDPAISAEETQSPNLLKVSASIIANAQAAYEAEQANWVDTKLVVETPNASYQRQYSDFVDALNTGANSAATDTNKP